MSLSKKVNTYAAEETVHQISEVIFVQLIAWFTVVCVSVD
jgi:hypothetical protein